MMNGINKDDLRYKPLYTVAEVSRYARVLPTTLRSWTRSEGGTILVPAERNNVAPLSFINLIESHVLRALRLKHRVPMKNIHRAIEWLRETHGTDHPFAELDLETDGSDVFIRILGYPISASRKGQGAIPEILSRFLQRIERDPKHIPIRFYPIPYDKSPKQVVMDPAVAYGRPVVTGTRITTLMVFERYSGGESLKDIATDYDLEIDVVEEALRCEIEQRAA
jgi:uncharacterized protein (DUF433 family)